MKKKFILVSILIILLVLLFAFFSQITGLFIDKNQKSIRIGAILPLSGNSAKYGKWIQEGLELALYEMNAEKDTRYKIEIIYEDSQCNPKIGIDAMNKLTRGDNIFVVLGGWCSAVTLAAAPIAEDTKTVFISFGASPKIRFAGNYIFRNKPDATLEAKDSSFLAYNILRLKNISVIYVNNDFGVGFKNTFEEHYTKLGGKVVNEEAFEYGATDFRIQLLKIKNTASQAIFMVGYIYEDGLILKQAKELGIQQQVITTALFENPDVFDIAGEAAEGVIYSYYGIDEDDKLAKDYQQKYVARYGNESEAYAAFAYDAIKLVIPIILECDKNSVCIKDSLYKVKEVPGVTGLTTFDEYGDVIKPVMIKTVRNRTFVKYNE